MVALQRRVRRSLGTLACVHVFQAEMRRPDTYCSNFSCTPATLAVGLRPGARRAMGLPSAEQSLKTGDKLC
jgi:hypothetical protein